MKIEIGKDVEIELNDDGEGWKETWRDEQGRRCTRYLGPQPPERVREIIDRIKQIDHT